MFEMDNHATYSACRGILLVCRGILLDVVTHVAAHKHENEVGWFWRQKRETPCQLPFQLNWLTGSMVEKILEKIGILLNDLERNSSGGNEDKQNEDVESVMARLIQVEEVRVVKEKD